MMVRSPLEDVMRVGKLTVFAVGVAVILALGSATAALAAFPGGNGKLAFASNRTTGQGVDNPQGDQEIFTVNPDGTGLTQLTSNAADDDEPAWSADGRRLVFHTDRDGNYEIYTMNGDGSGQSNRTNNPADEFRPVFSPDGTKIAFESLRTGNPEIFAMDVGGTNLTNVSRSDAHDQRPAWSPDGSKIAFQTDRTGDGEIFTASPAGDNPTNVSRTSWWNDLDPNWSPDGRELLFVTDRPHPFEPPSFELYKMQADGSNQTRLNISAASDVQPAFSPDGETITFTSDRNGNFEVYVGCCLPANVTNNPAVDASSDWQPIIPAPFVVNSTADGADAAADGVCDADAGTAGQQCTLRAALNEANNTRFADTINFNIPGSGVKTISPSSALGVTAPVTINGYTQPGSKPNTRAVGNDAVLNVELSGEQAGWATGLDVWASGVVVKGLVINSFDGSAMGLFGDNNRVEGNSIGTDPTGTLDRGNFIGVELFGALDNTVGGTTPATRNVISGNEGFGVRIAGNPTFGNASGNRVQNNHIGTTKGGTAPLSNAFHGVEIFGSHAMNNTVGGVEAGAGNVIAFNGSDGVAVSTFPDGGVPVGNDVLSNSVHSNGGLGIDLGDDGPTANDPGDADSGPNLSQNFPEITSAKPIQRKKKKLTAIAGTLDSSAGGAFTVQVFSNPPGGDEGKRLVRTLADVRTNAEGSASFGFKVARSAAPAGSTVTATATDSGGNTSELSPARTVR